jgi:hypothetical protein
MLRKIFTYYLLDFLAWQRINAAIAKGGVMMQARRIDLSDPATWEFSGFSQNGEDGIVDILRRQLKASNRFFVEIGAADGIENNSSWLAVMEKYNGLMVEGNSWLAARANRTVVPFSIGAECINLFVDTKNIGNIKELMSHFDPDVFSLDIDGNDYYIKTTLATQRKIRRSFTTAFHFQHGRNFSFNMTMNSLLSSETVSTLFLLIAVNMTVIFSRM